MNPTIRLLRNFVGQDSCLTILELSENVIQPGSINTIGLTVNGFNQLFCLEFLKTASVQSLSSST